MRSVPRLRLGGAVLSREGRELPIIDERVAWFGSLNIVSHSRSTEWMTRFIDPPVVQRMAEVTGAAGLIQRSDKQDTLRQLGAGVPRLRFGVAPGSLGPARGLPQL